MHTSKRMTIAYLAMAAALLALFALSKLSPRFHRWLTSRHWYQRMVVPVLEKFHAKRQTKKRVLIKAEQD